MHKRFWWTAMLVTALVLVSLGGAGSLADIPSTGPSEPVVVRLYVESREHLDAVAGSLDIWEVHRDQGYVVAAVQPAEYRWLEDLGYRLEIDVEKTRDYGIQAPLDPRFHYYDDHFANANDRYVVDFLQEINTAYPTLTELVDIGDAWLAGQVGEHDRDIWVLRITNEDAAFGPIEDKPAFFLFGGIHAREVAIPELVIRYIKYLTGGYGNAGGYGQDADATWLVDHNVLYALVMQNPDGHWKNEEDIGNYRRKNMDNDDGCGNPSTWGVDLNRNHSFFWGCCGGSSGSPCDTTYRGPAPASEPETVAFQNYFATVMEDQNGPNGNNTIAPASPLTTTGVFLSLHSYSDLVLWPWYLPPNPGPPNASQLETIGRKLATFNNYDPSGNIWYTVDGPTDDWTYGKFGIASFTFEVGPSGGTCGGFFPDYECIDGAVGWSQDFWAENGPAFLYTHKIARTPYMTAYGPDTEDVAVDPQVAVQGEPVELTATITDDRYGGDPLQPIAAAEYFVGAPGEDGTGTAMAASDGYWGGTTEAVAASLDTTALPLGKHYILVHGRNNQGDWGPFTAVFLEVVNEPAVPEASFYNTTPVCQEEDVVFTNTSSGSAPLGYAWSFGDGQTSTERDPVHAYMAGGTYTPVLTVTNLVGSDVTTGTVMVKPLAQASFVYTPTVAEPGEWIQFTDTSSGDPVEWNWTMGDGAVSNVATPAHRYTATGTYTVTLRVRNDCGWSPVYSQTVAVAEPAADKYLYYLPFNPATLKLP